MDNEICPQMALLYAHEQNCKCYLPKISFDKPTMNFHEYSPRDKLAINKLGIEEPSCKNIIHPQNLDVVFVPLVAFDKSLHRLGRGKGYYDLAFEFKKNTVNTKPLLVGLGYEFQLVNAIIPEVHDVKLDQIITEQENYTLTKKT